MNENSELKSFLIFLYRYFITLRNIVKKLRKKQRGRFGQLTEEEERFLKPIYENFDKHMRLDDN